MRRCPACGQETPPGNYCVRCGAPLADEAGHEGPSRRRGEFAAAPHERVGVPRLVSTLFPQLPRADLWSFRAALLGGAAVVVVLAAFRLLPVALLAAALLVPLLTVLYLHDVDVYEDDPVWAVAATVLWGAVSGVGVALLARAVEPTGTALIDRGSTAHVVTGGILLPLLGVVLMLGGTLTMLPYRRFNDVLDGATFGAVTAATFGGAEAVVFGTDVLGAGVRPVGDALPWIWRLLTISIGLPVVAMAAVGFAAAAWWLRHRAPVKDRRALGPLGNVAVATVLAGALVAGATVGETFLPGGAWLAWVVAFDLVALLLLRRAIHVGLLEESAEMPIGPPIVCANCGAQTPRHTFCSNCGIALAALPKPRPVAAPPPAPGPAREAGA